MGIPVVVHSCYCGCTLCGNLYSVAGGEPQSDRYSWQGRLRNSFDFQYKGRCCRFVVRRGGNIGFNAVICFNASSTYDTLYRTCAVLQLCCSLDNLHNSHHSHCTIGNSFVGTNELLSVPSHLQCEVLSLSICDALFYSLIHGTHCKCLYSKHPHYKWDGQRQYRL